MNTQTVRTARLLLPVLRQLVRGPLPPVNYRSRSRSFVAADVEYAISVGEDYRRLITERGIALSGTRLLEIGPGTDFGALLILASHGVRAAVADRFLCEWDENFHPDFYRALREKYQGPHSAIDAVIDAGGYIDSTIQRIYEPAEMMTSVPDAVFDVVVSNAVLEHIADLQAVVRTFARITKRGGLNIHQIDLRDHNDFSRPMESLLLHRWAHQIEFKYENGEKGNRVRLSEFVSEFERANFNVLDIERNGIADAGYLREFIPRLRRSWSTYRNWPADDLAVISAKLTLSRL